MIDQEWALACVIPALPDTRHLSTLVLQMRCLLVGSPCARGQTVPGYRRRRGLNHTMAWSNLVRIWSLRRLHMILLECSSADIVFFGEALPDRFAKCAGEVSLPFWLLLICVRL